MGRRLQWKALQKPREHHERRNRAELGNHMTSTTNSRKREALFVVCDEARDLLAFSVVIAPLAPFRSVHSQIHALSPEGRAGPRHSEIRVTRVDQHTNFVVQKECVDWQHRVLAAVVAVVNVKVTNLPLGFFFT